MAYGVYQRTAGWLHRIEPAAKIVALLAWFGVALLASRPASLLALSLLVILCALSARVGGTLLRHWRFMTVLFVMSALFWAVFSRSTDLQRGVWMGLRLATMLAMGLVFLASTRVEELAVGLQRLGLPFMAAFALTLAFRLLPLFAGTGHLIIQAQACRGLDSREGGPLARLRKHGPLLVPLVLSSLRTADALAVALESRGLGMSRTRTSILTRRPGLAEALTMAASLGALALCLWGTLTGRAL